MAEGSNNEILIAFESGHYKKVKGESKIRARENKVTSVKKAESLGIDVEKEVHRLLAAKKKVKTTKEAKQIRQQLRKLDYKRYI